MELLATVDEMRRMDRHAIKTMGIPARLLMENAAGAVAHGVESWLPQAGSEAKVVVCCGVGNNGGDGFAVARLLKNRGMDVSVVVAGVPKGKDSLANMEVWSRFGPTLDCRNNWQEVESVLGQAHGVVDALFGTGLARNLDGVWARLAEAVNRSPAGVKVAVDIPSGVDADTGKVWGAAVRCTHTICLQLAKPGCYQHPGAGYAGEVHIADISIPLHWDKNAPSLWRITPEFVREVLPSRGAAAHKGSFGHLLTVCGSAGMGGAAWLAAYAGLKAGAGLVTAAVPLGLRDRFLEQAPELMTFSTPGVEMDFFEPQQVKPLLDMTSNRTAAVLGCGLGRQKATVEFTSRMVQGLKMALVLDADGLYQLDPNLLKKRKYPTILTPHPGELAALTGLDVELIQQNRARVACKLAKEWGVVLVLKGAGTVVASPHGGGFINTTGDSGLATAGTGDVLTGVIGGLLAQGVDPLDAALAGVHLHGMSRDCQKQEITDAFFSARDLLGGINTALKQLGAV
ncbi:MAG: NAD(P)H-hydrate dehydratase [Deltaproteobacteria bacterium]|nr:NAD(P)H-hydrate dehydratase [Deltaproteobacteria bacterium]